MIGNSPNISTRRGLKDYILRNLGHPVINVEVHDTQLNDAIDTTMAEFMPFASDGVQRRWKVLQINHELNEQIYDLDFRTYAVLSLNAANYLDSTPAPSDLFNVNQYIANDLMRGGLAQVDILTLELVQQQISTLGVVFGKKIEFEFNTISKQLYIHGSPKGLPNCIFMEFYKTLDYNSLDDNEINNIYDVKWVQQFSTALARMQWGFNLMKYEGTTLPNGMTINAQATLEQGKADVEYLKQQLMDEWQDPVDFMIG